MASSINESKKRVLECLKRADESAAREQDRYLEIVASRRESVADEKVKAKLVSGGSKVLQRIMQDCFYPPNHQERMEFLRVDWDQEVNRIKLEEKISDFDVRARTFFLNETMEQAQRFRAMAMFSERAGGLRCIVGKIFYIWAQWSLACILYAEAVEIGKDREAQAILAYYKTMEGLIDFYIDKWGEGTTLAEFQEVIAKVQSQNPDPTLSLG